MTILICGSTSESITLLGEPIESGEAKVWRTNHNGYLAKIYHSPTPERVQKLAVMISHRPTEPNSHLNHISFAWPQSSLRNAQGDCVGFLMPEIKGAKELLDVYNPQRRKKLKLEIDWRFLHTTALNIASIIEAIHASGYVLGDIKPQNILVNNRALPSIIDTDSFQVRHLQNGKVYRCLVGSPGFTPSELINKDLSTIDQTEVHDHFRLAVIIYHLLFGGESPFQGQWIGAGDSPEINELIRRGVWLYAPNSLIQPISRTIPFEIVHPEVQRCFLQCFNDGHKNVNFRPSARDWVKALKLAVNDLTICGKVDSHYYSRNFGKCYWCDRANNLGADIFPGKSTTTQQQTVAPTKTPKIQHITLVNTLLAHSAKITCLTYSPDGKTLASGSYDNTIKLWDVATGMQICTLQSISARINDLTYSPDGKTIASGCNDSTIKMWDVVTGREIHSLKGHSARVLCVAYSPDGKTLASGSKDSTIKLWDVATGRKIHILQGHATRVNTLAYSPNGKVLASGGDDNTIKLWDVITKAQICTLQGHSAKIFSLAYSPDGKTLASGSGTQDKTIKLWDVANRREIHTLKGHSSNVISVVYSPDGKTLASGSDDNTIKLWDVVTGTQIYSLHGHSSSFNDLIYNPDGKTIASGSSDHTIKIWQLTSSTTKAASLPVKPIQSQVPQLKQTANLPSQVLSAPASFTQHSQPSTVLHSISSVITSVYPNNSIINTTKNTTLKQWIITKLIQNHEQLIILGIVVITVLFAFIAHIINESTSELDNINTTRYETKELTELELWKIANSDVKNYIIGQERSLANLDSGWVIQTNQEITLNNQDTFPPGSFWQVIETKPDPQPATGDLLVHLRLCPNQNPPNPTLNLSQKAAWIQLSQLQNQVKVLQASDTSPCDLQ
ncbi:MAG: hypothetical protein KME59_18930 [Trichormus sp. ATA11-4-KO1]|jgi:WD40 repeat protein|nr:hypothetical protein [Trichormus sp. ATA11-4-KO1]